MFAVVRIRTGDTEPKRHLQPAVFLQFEAVSRRRHLADRKPDLLALPVQMKEGQLTLAPSLIHRSFLPAI